MLKNDTFIIQERQNYSPKIGLFVSQLQNARHYLKAASRNLSIAQLQQQPPNATNTIGQILAHIAAVEVSFQAITFLGRRYNEQEKEEWGAAFAFEPSDKAKQTMPEHLSTLNNIRQETLKQLQSKTDDWLETEMTFFKQPANMHYYWFHFLQDEVRHTGQLSLIRKHLIKDTEPDFNPYSVS